MINCTSYALLVAANEELEFNKQEASLSQSSDTPWPQSFRSPSKPLTVVNAPGTFQRKDSDIIKAAKENLRKFPSKSSMKRKEVDIELALASERTNSSSARTVSSVSTMSSEGSDRNKSLLEQHSNRYHQEQGKDSSHHSHNGQEGSPLPNPRSLSSDGNLAPSSSSARAQEEDGYDDYNGKSNGSQKGKHKGQTTNSSGSSPQLSRNVSFCQEVILIQYYR